MEEKARADAAAQTDALPHLCRRLRFDVAQRVALVGSSKLTGAEQRAVRDADTIVRFDGIDRRRAHLNAKTTLHLTLRLAEQRCPRRGHRRALRRRGPQAAKRPALECRTGCASLHHTPRERVGAERRAARDADTDQRALRRREPQARVSRGKELEASAVPPLTADWCGLIQAPLASPQAVQPAAHGVGGHLPAGGAGGAARRRLRGTGL